MTIKKGDNVIILTGKDKGKQAKVVRTVSSTGRVLVDGLNTFKKHERPRQQGKKGQVVERAMPLHASNIALYCSKCKAGRRFGLKLENGKKVRVCRKCESEL